MEVIVSYGYKDLDIVKRSFRLKQPSEHLQIKGMFELAGMDGGLTLRWAVCSRVKLLFGGNALNVGLALILCIPKCRTEDAMTKAT